MAQPLDRPRPLPLLSEAVSRKFRPMMSSLYRGGSLRGWKETAEEFQLLLKEFAEVPELDRWLDRANSSWGRDYKEARRELLTALNSRRFDDVDFVAVVMDGTPIGGQQVVWAIGVTTDGTKIPLGVASGKSESTAFVKEFVDRLHGRGLDTTDVLWTIDGHSGLRAGIQAATHGRAAVQLCRVHKQRNILEPLTKAQREANYKEIGDRLDAAWALTDPAEAAKALEDVADWLESRGFKDSAAATRHDIQLTLTVQRLGLTDPKLVKKFTTTNMQESANRSVSDLKKKIAWRRFEGQGPTTGQEQAPDQPAIDPKLAELEQLADLEARAAQEVPSEPEEEQAPRSKRRAPMSEQDAKEMREGTVAVAVAGLERKWAPVVKQRETLLPMPLAVLRDRRFPTVDSLTAAADGTLTVHRLPAKEANAYAAVRDVLRHADRTGATVVLEDGAFPDTAIADAMRPWLEQCGFADGARAARPRGALGWTQVPPVEFSTRTMPVPDSEKNLEQADRLAREALGLGAAGAEQPAVFTAGSANALERFGLSVGQSLTAEQAVTIMRGHDVADAEAKPPRPGTPQKLRDATGELTGQEARSVAQLAWELSAPPAVVDRWLQSGREDRATLEQTLLNGARAGLERFYGDHELAVAMTLDRGTAAAAQLRVRGVVFGVLRDGALTSPVAKGVLPKDAKLDVARGDAVENASGLLDAQLARMGPAAGLALPRGLDEKWSTADHLSVLGEERASKLAAAAKKGRPVLADAPLRWLVERHRDLVDRDPFGKLNRAGAARALSLEQRQAALAADGGDARALQAVEQELGEVHRAGDHPNRWSREHGVDAVKLLAFEAELADRASAIAQDGGIGHLLEGHREALGGRHMRRVTYLAQNRARQWADRPDAFLTKRVEQRTVPAPDREAGWIVRRIERQRATLARQHASGQDVSGQLAQLELMERGLRSEGRHPDSWMARNADVEASRVAAQALLNGRAKEVGQERTAAAAGATQNLQGAAAEAAQDVREPEPSGLGM